MKGDSGEQAEDDIISRV